MSTPEARFVELFKTWLVSLPHDLKIAFEAMDDENLPRSSRETAVGAIMFVVSPKTFVSDRNEAVASFADDAILLRLALRQSSPKAARMASRSAIGSPRSSETSRTISRCAAASWAIS